MREEHTGEEDGEGGTTPMRKSTPEKKTMRDTGCRWRKSTPERK